MKIQPVIMSGGAGTRLWPLSRRDRPKQFLPLTGERSLFQETVLRVSSEADAAYAPPVVIGSERHRELIAAQLEEIGVQPAAIILEPFPRNTAAVAAVAAAWTADAHQDALVLLTPADHQVADAAGFRAAVAAGARAAESGRIVTLGIKPDAPHTGYGYIQQAEKIAPSVHAIAAFREKPDAATAQTYLADGGYFWNAGVFLYSARTMLAEFRNHAHAIGEAALLALGQAVRDGDVIRLDDAAFSACPADSVDYAIMEKTPAAAVVAPVDAGWSDIGSWTAIDHDASNDADLVDAVECTDCLIHSTGPFVGAIGLDDLIIVATDGAVLVARKDRAQDVKKIVEKLKNRKRDDLL
ncbi:MAG: mannose-1-phosphate guanylyltransferase/mannose-6-phosphate isomerase [Parvularculaceae bacterium]